jgi:uncharacterized protein (DUF1501 family)
MNFENFQQRRDFLKAASTVAVGGGLPVLGALGNVAQAAGNISPTQVDVNYKAIVCVFFYGGQDNANTLIPYQDGNAAGNGTAGTNAEFNAYALARSNFTTANPAGDPPVQNPANNNGNLAYTRSQLTATALPATTTNRLTGNAAATAAGWTTNTYGRQFALHPSYAELRAIYGTGKLAVIANVGPLIAPINRDQWYRGTGGPRPVGLYSHDDQQKGWMSGTANIANPTVGIGGRIANNAAIVALNGNALVSTQISVNGINTFMLTDLNPSPSAIAYQVGTGSVGRLQTLAGPPVSTICNTSSSYITANPTLPYCVTGGPIAVNNGYAGSTVLKNAFLARVMPTASEGSSIYNDQWRQTMQQSITTQAAISAAFINSPPTEDIVGPFASVVGSGSTYNSLAAQLRMVATMIRASNQLGPAGGPMKRQVFFVGIGGFDTHGTEFWSNNPTLNGQISKAINAFWTAMGNVAVVGGAVGETAQKHVTLFTATDFGRTLDSNSKGSDHGWGSHHFVLGGDVIGGYVYGQDHNITAATAGTSPWLGTPTVRADLTAGALPRIGLPPNRYSSPNTVGARCNGLNHCLDRGELLPTTSGDAVIATIAKWFGVPTADLTGPTGVFKTLATAHPNVLPNAPNGFDIGFMA